MLGQRANGIIDTLQQIASGGQTGIQPQQSPTYPSQQINPQAGSMMLESAAINNPFRMQSDPAGSMTPAGDRMMAQMQSSPAQLGSALAKPTMPPEVQEKAQVAEAVARKAAANPEAAADPTFAEKVKGYFGNEENMLRLAMAFNTMRMEPDQQLGAYLGARLGKIQESKVSAAGAKDIASQLLKMGYPDYAKQVLANPNMAKDIYKQIIQKELKPESADKVSGVQYDTEGNAYVVVTAQGKEPQIKMLGIKGDTLQDKTDAETAALRMRENWSLSSKRSDEAMARAGNVRGQLDDYRRALQAVNEGADSGIIRGMLPAFDAQTAALRQAASRLGIGVINSATFGALSEKELDLALKTAIDTSLVGDELKASIAASYQATEKLYQALVDEAALMASMPYDEYIAMRQEREREKRKYTPRPSEVPQETWYAMTLDQKKAYYEAGNQ